MAVSALCLFLAVIVAFSGHTHLFLNFETWISKVYKITIDIAHDTLIHTITEIIWYRCKVLSLGCETLAEFN